MNHDDRLAARLCAALLEAGLVALPVAGVLTLLGGIGLLLAVLCKAPLATGLFGLAMACVPGLIWYALRVRFDVAAFREIGTAKDVETGKETDSLQQFDAALRQLGLRTQREARPLTERTAGARRLLVCLLSLTGAQLLLFLAGCVALMLGPLH